MVNLVYVHIGKSLPSYIYDSIYQSILTNHNTKIYILVSETLIPEIKQKINCFNLEHYINFNWNLIVEYIPLELLKTIEMELYEKVYISKLTQQTKEFRDAFWISTTLRFFYIDAFISKFNIQNVFHIENDIMIYTDLSKLLFEKELGVTRDNKERVIPGIMYFKNASSSKNLVKFINQICEKSNELINDMALLGMYTKNNLDNISLLPCAI